MKTHEFEEALGQGLGIVQPGTVFLAAVSGGADSTAMLAGLASLRHKAGFVLHCIHVNHGIRSQKENSGDAAAVKKLCRDLKVPCRIASVIQGRIAALGKLEGIGIEAAARKYRHTILRAEAKRIGASKILIAHTKDDALENMLMAFIRGSGPAGLALMPPGRLRILRPILGLGRSEVLEYLDKKGISYRDDSTNQDTVYFRNRVRHKLIPLLDREFPSWRTGALGLGETQGITASYLKKEAKKNVTWKPIVHGLETSGSIFFSLDEIIREEALYRGLKLLRKKRQAKFSMDKARMVSGWANKQPRRRVLRRFASGLVNSVDLGNIILKNEADKITLCFKPQKQYGFSLFVSKPGIYALPQQSTNHEIKVELLAPALTPLSMPPDIEGFFTQLPLVFRSEFSGDSCLVNGKNSPLNTVLPKKKREGELILAEDKEGIVAFIGLAQGHIKVLYYREKGAAEKNSLFFCRVHSWGFNAR